MESLRWVDQTYTQKHKSEDPSHLRAMFYTNLKMYPNHGSDQKMQPWDAAIATGIRYGRKAGISLAVFALSYIPYIGRFVLPAASFYTFNRAVGPQPAIVIFGAGIFLPRRYLVMFLQSYFASRSLMRELVSLLCIVICTILLKSYSWSLISHASATHQRRSEYGSATGKAFSLGSALRFTHSSRYRCLES